MYKRELSEIRPSDYTFENTDFNIPINVEVYEFKQRDKKNEFHYFLKKLKERWEMRSLILEKNLDGKQKNTGPEIERLKIILHHNEAFFWGQQWNLVGPYAPLSITDIQDTNRHLKIMARVFQVINEYPNHTF